MYVKTKTMFVSGGLEPGTNVINVIHSLVVYKPHTVNTVSTCCVSYVKWKIKASKEEHAATC